MHYQEIMVTALEPNDHLLPVTIKEDGEVVKYVNVLIPDSLWGEAKPYLSRIMDDLVRRKPKKIGNIVTLTPKLWEQISYNRNLY